MMVDTLTFNFSRFSSIEIAVIIIFIVILNLRVLSLTSKTKFLKKLRTNLILGVLPFLLISTLIMVNQFVMAVTNN